MKRQRFASSFAMALGGGTAVVLLTTAVKLVADQDVLGVSDLLSIAAGLAVALAIGTESAMLARAIRRVQRSPRVFVSYSKQDSEAATKIARVLRGFGAKVWLDSEELDAGDDIKSKIDRAIGQATLAVFVLSDSGGVWARHELNRAIDDGIPVVPILTKSIDEIQLPSEVRGLMWLSLSEERLEDYKALRRLIRT